jgi:hypothetical protein
MSKKEFNGINDEAVMAEIESTIKLKKGRVNLISGAVYHNFEENPIFKGVYAGECWNDEPKLIGFYFVDGDGEQVLITNAFSIEKALNTITEDGIVKDLGKQLEITFKGKSIIKKTGKPFNRFEVVLIND